MQGGILPLKALGSLSFQQDGSTRYAGKKVAECDFHWPNRGMHHASRALLHIFFLSRVLFLVSGHARGRQK